MTGAAAGWSRRRLLACGLGGTVAVLAAGVELVDHGVLPGKFELEELTGACSVPQPDLVLGPQGPSRSGRFYSRRRGREVGYTIAWPAGHRPGDELPLVVCLHGDGGNHRSGLSGVTLSEGLAGRLHERALPAMALVSVDGGNLYWNPTPATIRWG